MMIGAGWTPAEMPDLSGRRAVVTGGNSGIGLFTAQALAQRGAEVIITSRDAARGAAAVATIRAHAASARIVCRALDLADLRSVRAFAGSIDGALDLLINNAGVMAIPRRTLTADGFEMQFGTNHLGHFALTGLLLPRIGAGRIVSVSSLAHRRGAIALDDLQLERGYRPWRAYTQSKLANLMFALELQRRLARAGMAAISVAAHPGVAATNLAAAGPMMGRGGVAGWLGQAAFRMIGQSAEAGAWPTLMAATAADITGGAYIGPVGLREMRGNPAPAFIASRAREADVAAELWRRSEELTGVSYLN